MINNFTRKYILVSGTNNIQLYNSFESTSNDNTRPMFVKLVQIARFPRISLRKMVNDNLGRVERCCKKETHFRSEKVKKKKKKRVERRNTIDIPRNLIIKTDINLGFRFINLHSPPLPVSKAVSIYFINLRGISTSDFLFIFYFI